MSYMKNVKTNLFQHNRITQNQLFNPKNMQLGSETFLLLFLTEELDNWDIHATATFLLFHLGADKNNNE